MERNSPLLQYFIGIDSGATNTEVLILRTDGKVHSRKTFKPLNYNLLGLNASVVQLADVITGTGVSLKNVRAVAACVSGAGNDSVRKKLQKHLAKKLNFKNIKVYPDTAAAFASVFTSAETNCGILLAGTGSVFYFKKNGGEYLKVGGWGRNIGDEGSGYWIAREALGKITQYYDNRNGKTSLTAMIEKKFRINSRSIIKKIYHNNFDVAKISNVVFRCAERGDAAAKEIIMSAAEHIALHLKPIAAESSARIALCGSLFSKEKLLEKYFRTISKKNFPELKFIKPKHTPVWGAVKLAMSISPFEGREEI